MTDRKADFKKLKKVLGVMQLVAGGARILLEVSLPLHLRCLSSGVVKIVDVGI